MKLKIRAANSSEVLLKVVKNPVTTHLPHDTLKIGRSECIVVVTQINLGTSVKARLVKLKEFVPKIDRNGPLCFVVGGVSKGDPGTDLCYHYLIDIIALECDYLDDSVCVSRYSLSASWCLAKILDQFEDAWNIY